MDADETRIFSDRIYRMNKIGISEIERVSAVQNFILQNFVNSVFEKEHLRFIRVHLRLKIFVRNIRCA